MDGKEIFCEGAAPAWCAGEGVERVSCCLLQHPAPGAIPEPQFPFFVGFCGHCRAVGMSWSSPSAHSPSEHSKKEIPDYFVSQNSIKPWLCQGERGSQTLPGVHQPLSPSPDGVAGPSTGCSGFVLVLYWSCPGSQCPSAAGAPAPSSCPLLQHSQFPNPNSQFPFFSAACSDCAVLSSQPAG